LSRQERYAKEGDRDAAAPSGFPFVQVKKWESVETRFVSLRSNTTLSDPFSAQLKRQRLMRMKIQTT
jgi:hypothetical protein